MGTRDEIYPYFYIGNRLFDHFPAALCRFSSAMGKIADLIRDYAEPGSGFAGARRLDRGVEGQDIRVKSDFVNALQHRGHLVA